jgi:hypothetical protein
MAVVATANLYTIVHDAGSSANLNRFEVTYDFDFIYFDLFF